MSPFKQANFEALLAGLDLDRQGEAPLHRQLEAALRSAILRGNLPRGARLPPSRDLARHLRVSRTTVTDALEVLTAEGYLSARVGHGTFVAADATPPHAPVKQGRPSRRGDALGQLPIGGAPHTALWPPRAFRSGLPDLDAFPWAVWSRLQARHARQPLDLGYGDPAGYGPLREAIAAYLAASRGLRCHPDQVIVVNGSQQGLDLAARVLLDHAESAVVEDPGYLGARAAFTAAGLRLVPAPVDQHGMDIAAAEARAPHARLAYVTPSHQYPMGVVMSADRRAALLAWAARRDAWIIEDDYDGEYRYGGPPLTALHHLDAEGRVLYLGTFSKVLFPALRIGYLVVPRHLSRTFRAAKNALDRTSPRQASAALTDFITEGHFARHLRRARRLYSARHAVLLAQQATFGSRLTLHASQAGLHLVGHLPLGTNDAEVADRAWSAGIEVNPLSRYALHPTPPGLILGYAAISEDDLQRGAQHLAQLL